MQVKATGIITALNDKIWKMVFKGSRHPVHIPHITVDQEQIFLDEIEQLLCQSSHNCTPDQFEEDLCAPYTLPEFEEILLKLQKGKSSG